MAVVDVAEVAPIDLGIGPETITAITRISSYSRTAPLSEDYSASLPYFLAVVGTRSGYLHVVSVQPPRSALSLRPKHQRSYRHVVANDGVKSHSQRLSSTPVKGLHASPLISSLFARRSSSALGGAGSEGGGSSPQMSRDTSTTTPVKQRVRMAPSVTPTRASPGGGPNASMASSTTAARLLADESIRKVIFSPASCRVFALSAGKVYCHFVNIPSRFELELVGAVTIPGSADHLQGCIDFAVTNTPACPAQLVVLTTSKIVICTFDGPVPFHVNAIKSTNALGDTCAWVGSVISVASVADREYRFYTANSSKPLDRISAGERWAGGAAPTDSSSNQQTAGDDSTSSASRVPPNRARGGGKAGPSTTKAPINHAVVLAPLQDEFDYSDREKRIVAVDRCAVVVSAKSKSTLFRQSVLVLRCDASKGGIETIRRIPLLTTTPVKSLGMWGPWLVVAGSVGFETYSAITGDLIQSSLEEANIDCMSLATRASQAWNLDNPDQSIRAAHTSRGYELVLSTPRPGCNASAPYVSMVCFHPPFDVVCELLRDASTPWADDNSLLAEVLLRFAHSVGAEMISPEMALGNVSFDRPDRNDKEALSDEYDQLRASFRHVGGEVPKPKADNCAGCGTTFRFFRRPTPCAACGEHICDKCTSTVRSVVYNGSTDPDAEFFTEQKAKICGSCLTHCAPDLYRLIDNRLYVQAITLLFQRHRAKRLENMRAGRGSRLTGANNDDDDDDDDADDEMVAAATSDGDPTDMDGPEDVMVDDGGDGTRGGSSKKNVGIGSAFSLRRAGQVVLQRCLDDGKFAACVMLLPMVIGRSARRWRDWVFRFSTAKAVAMLARFVPWRSLRRHVDPWLFTYLLTTLTKQDPIRLCTTVGEWPADLYDADEVAFYITQALERSVRQADEAFATCRPHYWPEEDAASRAGVGLIYRTARVESLVRSVCLVHDRRGQSRQSVAAYLDHWLAFTPMWDRPRSTAPPSVATAPFMDPWQRIADDDLMGMFQTTATASTASPRGGGVRIEHDDGAATTSSGPLPSSSSHQRSYLDVMIRVKGRDSGEYLASLPEVKSRPMLIRSLVEQLQSLDADAKARKAAIVKRWGWAPVGASAADGVDISGVLLDFLDRLSSGSKEDIRVTEPFHEIQAELYITHKPDKLLWFLRNEFVSSVNWSRVNHYVRERRMYRELAYVVSRSGDYPEAIRLIIRCLKSVKYAIEFVVDVNGGPELWDQVMYHCRQNKGLLDDFLEHASGHVNLSKFFDDDHMPKRNRVRLGDAQVTGMLTKEHVNAALTESGAESFKTDNLIATGKLIRKRRAAVKFGSESLSKCHICEGPIVAADVVAMGSGCGHMFHMKCIEDRFAARRRLQRRGANTASRVAVANANTAAAAQKDEDKKRKSWQFRYGSYEVHKEVGTRDLAELLPPEYHARVMAYLPQERRRVAGLASKAWSRASVDAVVFDREETDATNMLRGQPHEVRRTPTVAVGSKHWSKEVCCVVCHGDLA